MNQENKMVNIFLMSAKKSGSSWLEEMVKQIKEIHFIDRSQFNLNEEKESFEINSKVISLDSKINCVRMNIKFDEWKANAIYDYNQNIKFIISLRHPINRILSHFKHYINKEKRINWKHYAEKGALIDGIIHPDAINIDNMTFDINKDLLSRRNLYDVKKNDWTALPGWIRSSFYYNSLKPYFNKFPKTNFKIILLEDISNNPASVLDDLLGYLMIDKGQVFKNMHRPVNSSKRMASDRLKTFYSYPPYSLGLRRYFIKNKYFSFTPMNDDTINYFKKLYHLDILTLSEYMDFDFLSYWDLLPCPQKSDQS